MANSKKGAANRSATPNNTPFVNTNAGGTVVLNQTQESGLQTSQNADHPAQVVEVETTASISRKNAQKVADELSAQIVYGNSRGEFFTMHNRALLSENGDTSKVEVFDFSKQVVTLDDTRPIEQINMENNIKHIITAEDLQNNPGLEVQGIKLGDEIDFVPGAASPGANQA